MDKTKNLEVSLQLINDKVCFKGHVAEQNPISIDYIPPLGDNLGYTSLELLLLSIGSCIGSVLLAFLRKQRKSITDFNIKASGTRLSEAPFSFKNIDLIFHIVTNDTSKEEVIKTFENVKPYCPVWDMIKNNVEIHTEFKIFNSQQ